MAKKVKDTKSLLKWKKKRWYKIVAPKVFREVVLGESFVMDSATLVGKTVKANLMNITGNARKQNMNVKFEVSEIQNDKAVTNLVSYEVIPSAIKRLVRRKRDKIELTPVLKSKDDVKFRIKPLIITKDNCANSIHTQMRKLVALELFNYATENVFEQLVIDIVSGKIQNDLKAKLKKLYPVRVVEIRAVTIEKSVKVKLTKVDTSFKVVLLPKKKVELTEEDAPEKEAAPKKSKKADAEQVEELSEESEEVEESDDDLEEDEKQEE
ncbi:hypothetical protein JXM83_00465 [Candidatus Woesearchaeota archaeon]|nr:hypothetical protein [Candidatus Woesearchaeota archaeon]